jgi:RimJ/RimL family protein N-acetyltransferase
VHQVPAVLTDGGTVLLRPMARDERAPLLSVFDGLSARSRELRFLSATPALRPSTVRALTAVDGCHHVAWLATVDGRPVGIARYVRVTDDTADLAVEVVDEHHGRGLGSVLLEAVATLARANGVARIAATVHPANRASVRLMRRFGLVLRLCDGVLEGESTLRLPEPARIDRAAVLALAVRGAVGAGGPLPCGATASSVA